MKLLLLENHSHFAKAVIKEDEFIIYLKKSGKHIPAIAISLHEAGNMALLEAGATSVCSKMAFRKINEVLANISDTTHIE